MVDNTYWSVNGDVRYLYFVMGKAQTACRLYSCAHSHKLVVIVGTSMDNSATEITL